jgi:hypothetical protein
MRGKGRSYGSDIQGYPVINQPVPLIAVMILLLQSSSPCSHRTQPLPIQAMSVRRRPCLVMLDTLLTTTDSELSGKTAISWSVNWGGGRNEEPQWQANVVHFLKKL